MGSNEIKAGLQNALEHFTIPSRHGARLDVGTLLKHKAYYDIWSYKYTIVKIQEKEAKMAL